VAQLIDGNAPGDDTPLVFASEVSADYDIGDRGFRKWQTNGKFPQPDGNLNGRNFWRRSTYRKWQADVLAGHYRKTSNLSRKTSAA
jgi:hypothetical protein